MKKITYEDKEYIRNDPSFPRTQTVTDEDMNEIKNAVNENADELDTAKEDIENLQKNDAQQDKSIEALQKENTELKEECSRLRQDLNAFPSGQAEGEYITLKDSADSRFNMFRVGGNSKQETREGYNILKEKYRQVTRSLSYILDKSKLTEKMYYSLIADFSSSSTNRIFLNNISASIQAINKGSMNIVANQKSTKEITFTAEELETLKNSEEDIIIQLYESDTNIDYSTKNFSEVMLSSSNNTKYEEYGAMPSPEYPSEIQNVEGNINVSVCNKNLVEGQWTTGLYNVNGDLDNTNGVYKCFKKFLKAGTYVYSYNADITIARYVNLTSKTNLSLNAGNKNFTLGEDAEISLGFRKTDSSTWDLGENLADIEFQLEPGNTATNYVEHQEQNFTFPLAQGQRLMLGDYLAQDGIHHVRKQNKPNELGGWNINTVSQQTQINTISFRYQIVNAMNSNSKLCLSNLFKGYKTTEIYNVDKEGIWIASNYIYVRINRNRLDTEDVEGFENFLVKNNIIVEYPLEEEEIEPYTEEQQKAYEQIVQTAKSYKNVTNIYSPDPVSPVFEVNYRKDIESMINNSLNNVNQQILNIV